MKRAKGFTLIELMIVVFIIGLLGSIAIPSYSAYVTRSKISEATSSLAAMRVQMEQFYQDTRSYLSGGVCGTIGATPTATTNFTYVCAGAANDYTITATGKGGMAGFSYSINSLNAKVTVGVPAGWTVPNPNTCWVTKKDGVC